MTDWERRKLEIALDFLPDGQYELEVWRDGVNADRNGQDFAHSTQTVSSRDKLTLELAPGGGWVGWLRPIAAKNKVSQLPRTIEELSERASPGADDVRQRLAHFAAGQRIGTMGRRLQVSRGLAPAG